MAMFDGEMMHSRAATIGSCHQTAPERADYMANSQGRWTQRVSFGPGDPRRVTPADIRRAGRSEALRRAGTLPVGDPGTFLCGSSTVARRRADRRHCAGRDIAGRFSDSQVALLQTFAEQAVIAITSAETYRALQARTADLQQSLEYQTATSDVLKVISSSNFALEPVFSSVVYTAVRLCHADQAVIYRVQDGAFRWAAGTDMLPEYERIERGVAIHAGPGTLIGRVALEARPVQILDAWTDPLYEVKDDARAGGVHTLLGVPLLRDGVPIGPSVWLDGGSSPITDREVELVTTFADQAVIAIENARLVAEQREALEQQTATAEVLQVINASPGDLAPVFDAMLEKAIGSVRGRIRHSTDL